MDYIWLYLGAQIREGKQFKLLVCRSTCSQQAEELCWSTAKAEVVHRQQARGRMLIARRGDLGMQLTLLLMGVTRVNPCPST